MRQRFFRSIQSALLCAALGSSLACSSRTTAEAPKEQDPKLAQYELKKLPADVEHKVYLDFGGKVQLLGYDISPDDVAPPGSTISLTLYWQRTGNLGKGWKLFTHILDARGRQIAQYDSSGPLREGTPDGGQALGPSDWKIGSVYKDAVSFQVPRTLPGASGPVPLDTGLVTIAVGVWKEDARLDVLGGNSDAHRRGFVTSLKTGVAPAAMKQPGRKKASDG